MQSGYSTIHNQQFVPHAARKKGWTVPMTGGRVTVVGLAQAPQLLETYRQTNNAPIPFHILDHHTPIPNSLFHGRLPANTNNTRGNELLDLGADIRVSHVLGQRGRIRLCLLENRLHHRILHDAHNLQVG